MNAKYAEDPTRTMKAAEWHGKEDIRVVTRPAPAITDPADAIVRVTSMTICGSDLHMYFNVLPAPRGAGMQTGDIMGHESMGVVDSVGPNVKYIKVGDRVVISAPISCGSCEYCLDERYSQCDRTNPAATTEYLYGHRTSAIFGYSHLTGGVAGGQADYCRVPFADVNLLPVPPQLTDEQVLLLSDVICTGYHGTELGEVKPGSKVVVWGCGPVGLMAQYCAKQRGAAIVIGVDNQPERLAKAAMVGSEPLNFDDFNVTEELAKRIPGGPSVCIDCVGYRFPKGVLSWLQWKTGMETDSGDIIREMVLAGKKGARLALIGDYFNFTNGFPIGAFMEKGQSMAGGQLFCQKYWRHLLSLIDQGVFDATWLFSHRFHLDDIATAYKRFAHHEDNCTKVIVKTDYGLQQEAALQAKGHTTAGQAYGRVELGHKPAFASTPIHLAGLKEGSGPQVHAKVGASGTAYSPLVQGGTDSAMGTNTFGAK